MELSNLRDLLVEELRDLYSAENQLLKALPKMAKAATSKPLKNGFNKHLRQTEGHVNRLEKVFDRLGVSPRGKKCHAMEALIAEGEELISQDAEPEVLDAGLIAAAQRVEHYEIAGYGCVRTYAKLLGDNQSAKLLDTTLKEEGATDKQLTRLAEKINVQAEDAEAHPPRKKKKKAKSFGEKVREAVGL
jgi:ferritin-like metal-binding protein YciE